MQMNHERAPVWRDLRHEIGMAPAPDLWRDWLWWAAMAASLPVAAALARGWPDGATAGLDIAGLVAMLAWRPLLEELLFRGILQGQLGATRWGGSSWAGVSVANALTSGAFVLAHLWAHPVAWAAAVIVPSLVFGLFRERHASIIPAVLLHCAYNAAYFIGQRWFVGL